MVRKATLLCCCGLPLVVSLAFTTPALAQKSTEVFIPVGQSPGLSGNYSVMGTITELDARRHLLIVRTDSGVERARITEATKIWLDRSEVRATSRSGSHADCRSGRVCEVKFVYENGRRTDRAEWIKIRVSR